MQQYVLGFAFYSGRVLLMRKKHPDWQMGKLNGIGGKIEDGENPLQAMNRETKEEACLENLEWQYKVLLTGPDWYVHVFACEADIYGARAGTDEELVRVPLHQMCYENPILNLLWLVPLCADDQITAPVTVGYSR